MKRLLIFLVVILAGLSVLSAGCGQAAPSPTPTRSPAAPTSAAEPTKPAAPTAAPTKAAEPTKPAAAAPTAVPAKTVSFPEKGKTVTIVLPWSAGGSADVACRLLAPLVEKELGVPVQIVNKPGASGQVGLSEVVKAKPDGYTLIQSDLTTYAAIILDPGRKAGFTRKDFQGISTYGSFPEIIVTKADSPYKSMKDLLEAAKAKPETVTMGTPGLQSGLHFGALQLGLTAGAKFSFVHFNGGSEAFGSLMGGHIDAQSTFIPTVSAAIKAGQVRGLGVMEKQRTPLMPDLPTMEEQGYKFYASIYQGIMMPAGAPREVVDTLNQAFKKALTSEEIKTKYADLGLVPTYMTPEQYDAAWAEQESVVKELLPLAK